MGSGAEILLNVEWYGPVIVDEYASSDWVPGEEHEDAPRTDFEIAKRACEEAKDSIVNGTSTIFIVYYNGKRYVFDVEEDWNAQLIKVREEEE